MDQRQSGICYLFQRYKDRLYTKPERKAMMELILEPEMELAIKDLILLDIADAETRVLVIKHQSERNVKCC